MRLLKGLNQGIAFGLELAMLAAITFAGYMLFDSMILGLAVSFMALMWVMVIWALYASPRAVKRLPRNPRIALKFALFFIAGLGLILVDQPLWGVLLILAFLIHEALAITLGQET